MELHTSNGQGNNLIQAGTDWHLNAFDVEPRTRLVFGEGKVAIVRDLVRQLGGSRVLVVTDPGIVEAGHHEVVVGHLKESGVEVFTYDQVRENPTTRDVAACVSVARDVQADLLIGLGGGSSMDTAKGCNFILTNGGCMQDYWGIGKASKPMLPLIAIPTTAGTGSECQSFALIADEASHQKMACGDPKAAARVSILDPALTVSQPARVTACTGMDALTHALETAVTRKRTLYSWMHALEAFKLLMPNFATVLEHPDDLQARGKMLLGAAFAGIAIENSMLGAAHATANPLTASFGVIHGMAVGVMMPQVIRWNSRLPVAASSYAQLSRESHVASSTDSDPVAVEKLIEQLESLLNLALIPVRLRAHGVKEEDLSSLSQAASSQWTGQFNPVHMEQNDFVALYRMAL